jgi:flagellar biosynthetic protein FliR
MENIVLFFGLTLARTGAFVAVLPILGGTNTPRLVKAGLAFALAVFWFGIVAAALPPDVLFGKPIMVTRFAFTLAAGREVILGALMGFAFGLFQVPAHVAGEFLTEELGLSFGAFLNPTGTSNVSALTQIIDTFGIFVFLGLDGHHLFLAALHASFTRYPVGGSLPDVPVEMLAASMSTSIQWGLVLAAPMALSLFLVTLVLAVMTRAAPQINLFTVGFPLRLVSGLVAVFVFFPNFLTSLVDVLGHYGEMLTRLI